MSDQNRPEAGDLRPEEKDRSGRFSQPMEGVRFLEEDDEETDKEEPAAEE